MAVVFAALGLSRVHGLLAQRQKLASAVLLMLVWVELRPATWYASQSHYIYEPMVMSDAYPFLSSESDRGGLVELPSRTEAPHAAPRVSDNGFSNAPSRNRTENLLIKSQLL